MCDLDNFRDVSDVRSLHQVTQFSSLEFDGFAPMDWPVNCGVAVNVIPPKPPVFCRWACSSMNVGIREGGIAGNGHLVLARQS